MPETAVQGRADASSRPFLPRPEPLDEGALRINLSWRLRLRWSAIAGQVATILFVDRLMHIQLPMLPLFVVVGLEVMSNIAAVRWAKRATAVRDWEICLILGLDVVFLSSLLYFTGGPFNPFSFLYLVYVAQAAVVLPARWTWGLVVLSLGCLGVLFLKHTWLVDAHTLHADPRKHSEFLVMHVQGMWIAFGIAAGFIVYFVSRVTRELGRARAYAARAEKLGSLATLATGAAHELSTPLSTIAVAAKELERDLEQGVSAQEAISDARLIRQEVERCREILLQMTADAGGTAGEGFQRTSVSGLLDAAMAGLASREQLDVHVEPGAGNCSLYVPPHAAGQALRGVIKNALQASPPAKRVAVRVLLAGSSCRFEVKDEGDGMAPDVLARAGEPFFSTKEAGRGMGLGLFLTRVVLERLGGQIDLTSAPGIGTKAVLTMPLTDPATKGRIESAGLRVQR
jgi:two-component system sensor histidine kinase RegB